MEFVTARADRGSPELFAGGCDPGGSSLGGTGSPRRGPAVPRQRRSPDGSRPMPPEPVPDEPVAVVVAGCGGDGRGAVIGALLNGAGTRVNRPESSYLVVRYGSTERLVAHLPGRARPLSVPTWRWRAEHPVSGDPAVTWDLPRPPRRIEVTLADPLLRHLTLVETPDTGSLGRAGADVLLEAAGRGGALLFVIGAGPPPGGPEFDLLGRAVRGGVTVFFAVTPGGAYSEVDSHREALTTAVPELVGASWYMVDPAAADVAYLRRALIDWADLESLRRAGGEVTPPYGGRSVSIRGAGESGSVERLDPMIRTATRVVRQRVAVALANIHVDTVRDILFGSGCPGAPHFFDRELLALSLRIEAECAAAADRIIADVLGRVLRGDVSGPRGGGVSGLRGGGVSGLRGGGVSGLRGGGVSGPWIRYPASALLVTAAAEVTVLTGPGPVRAFAAYPAAPGRALLPPIGVALATDCFTRHGPGGADVNRMRTWVQRAIRTVELELLREISRRFAAVRHGLETVLAESSGRGSAGST